MKTLAISTLLVSVGSLVEAQSLSQVRVFPDLLILLLILILCVLVLMDYLSRRRRPEDSQAYKDLTVQNTRLLEDSNANKVRAEEAKDRSIRLESQLEQRQATIHELENKVMQYDASEEQRKKDSQNTINQLEESRKSLQEERQRVIQEETEARREAEENRNRVWSAHEENSKQKMAEICRKSGIGLAFYDNTNLPDSFDPGFKPDFMVRLLDQYVIFDPKSSTAANLQSYLANQAKSTAGKIAGSTSATEIYKTVFFVVPGIAIPELTETYYLESGISFYIIPLEAFEPIIRTLKRLEDYDLADKYDPQERENIVTVLATFENHIREQNATNILSTARGLQTLAARESMPDDVVEEVEARRKKVRISGISQTQLKKLMNSSDTQAEELRKLIAPQNPPVEYQELAEAQEIVAQDESDPDT